MRLCPGCDDACPARGLAKYCRLLGKAPPGAYVDRRPEVAACDYRSGPIEGTAGACGCNRKRYLCALGLGPGGSRAVDDGDCLRCKTASSDTAWLSRAGAPAGPSSTPAT